MTVEQRLEVVLSMLENWNRGDVDAALACTSPDCHLNGRPAAREFQRQRAAFIAAFVPDGQYLVRRVVDEGDRVTLHWEFRGTHREKPPITVTGLNVYHFEDDQIVDIWEHARTPNPLNNLRQERGAA